MQTHGTGHRSYQVIRIPAYTTCHHELESSTVIVFLFISQRIVERVKMRNRIEMTVIHRMRRGHDTKDKHYWITAYHDHTLIMP